MCVPTQPPPHGVGTCSPRKQDRPPKPLPHQGSHSSSWPGPQGLGVCDQHRVGLSGFLGTPPHPHPPPASHARPTAHGCFICRAGPGFAESPLSSRLGCGSVYPSPAARAAVGWLPAEVGPPHGVHTCLPLSSSAEFQVIPSRSRKEVRA